MSAHRKRCNHPKNRPSSGEVRAVAQQQRQPGAQRHSDHSSHRAQCHRFDQELQQDVPAFRPNCLSHSNFPRSFRHRHQHDIHHSDAADQQSHRRHRKHQRKNQAADLVPQIPKIIRGKQRKIVRLVVAQSPLPPQQVPYLLHRLRHQHRVLRFRKDHVILLVRIELPQCRHRHGSRCCLQDSRVGRVITEKHHRRAVRRVRVVNIKPTALGHLNIKYLLNARRIALQDHIFRPRRCPSHVRCPRTKLR